MRVTRGPVLTASALGVLVAAVLTALTFASAAYATASVTINSFKYNPTDSSGQSLILTATNSGSASITEFGFQLVPGYTISNVVLTVGGMTYTTYCAAQNGGSRPTVDCTIPAGLIPSGASFTIALTTAPAYPANQSNFYFANDGTGQTTGTFMGPTPTAPCPAITLSPPVLPSGSPGQAYEVAITASGGSPPYTFTVGGGLPPGVTVSQGILGDLELTGVPTAPGTYNFVVNVVDANGCPGSRSFTIDVFQPVTPPPCKCSRLKIKLDPTLLNKKRLRPDQHDFGVGFVWRMTCTSGGGGCNATVSFHPPTVFAGAIPLPKQNFHLNLKRMTFTCNGPCTSSSTGHIQIKMLSRGQLNMLFGRTLAYHVVTRCGGVVKVLTVRVFIDDHGVLRLPK